MIFKGSFDSFWQRAASRKKAMDIDDEFAVKTDVDLKRVKKERSFSSTQKMF